MTYFRPIPMTDPARPQGALTLAGGWCWFDRAEAIERSGRREIVAASDLPDALRIRLTEPRPAIAGLAMDRPQIMGILNVTPDSFSDGGRHDAPDAARVRARAIATEGAAILDIGGESTRPGATDVAERDEIERTAPLIAGLREIGVTLPISIDTRKAGVARAALAAGADLVNDVSALTYDPEMAALVAAATAPVCLMHARGTPQTMQDHPRYDDVLLDIYDFLEARIAAAEAAGIHRTRIVVDPGIGFGMTNRHILAVLRGLSLYHGLGCALLVGASRKRFIGTIGGAEHADERAPGSIAVALAAVSQGVQILRVHDIWETRQALRLWQAAAIGMEG